ncbi:hypothetical protein [Thiohalorhabdus methylotrophus]|uniref:Outer membrane protein beta-barrel domain-containing protein n=1 Tax=Thiohalorhabdus methylotrophus TaxID=3242694 RepID=A0ABV4U0K6_9GAMM
MKHLAAVSYTLFSLALSLPASAGVFVGGEIGSMHDKTTVESKTAYSYDKVSAGEHSRTRNLRLGYVWEKHRIYGMFHSADTGHDTSEIGLKSLHYNYLIPFPPLPNVKIALGATAGIFELTYETAQQEVVDDMEMEGWIYGPEASVLFPLFDFLELEVGYRYWFSSLEHTDKAMVNDVHHTWTTTTDSVSEWGVGLNFTF